MDFLITLLVLNAIYEIYLWLCHNKDGDDKKAEELIKEADKSDDEKSEDSDKDTDNDDSDSDAEKPNDKGERKIELEDMQLWKNMDLNKDGRLTIAEYERWASLNFLCYDNCVDFKL